MAPSGMVNIVIIYDNATARSSLEATSLMKHLLMFQNQVGPVSLGLYAWMKTSIQEALPTKINEKYAEIFSIMLTE